MVVLKSEIVIKTNEKICYYLSKIDNLKILTKLEIGAKIGKSYFNKLLKKETFLVKWESKLVSIGC